jgi:hypothetical protein
MMNAEHGLRERIAERVGDARADEERAGKPRTARLRNRIEIARRDARASENVLRERQDAANVIARCEFGHDAAERLVERRLRMQRVGDEAALGVVQRDTGLVAGRLDAQYAHGAATITALACDDAALLYLQIT